MRRGGPKAAALVLCAGGPAGSPSHCLCLSLAYNDNYLSPFKATGPLTKSFGAATGLIWGQNERRRRRDGSGENP